MHSVEAEELPLQYIQIARKFVALYYRVLNDYSDYLHRFYGSDSTVVVCEVDANGEQKSTKAGTHDLLLRLLSTMYADVTVTVRNCTPQPSSGDSLSLLVTGTMTRKHKSNSMSFTQALILSRQQDGYYIKTDTVLVFTDVKTSPCTGKSTLLASILPSTMCTATNESSSHKAEKDESVESAETLKEKCPSVDDINEKDSSICASRGGFLSHFDVGHENKQFDNKMIGFNQHKTSYRDGEEVRDSVYGEEGTGKILCMPFVHSASNPQQLPYPMKMKENGVGTANYRMTTVSEKERSGSPFSAPATFFASSATTFKLEADPHSFQSQSQMCSPRTGAQDASQAPPTDNCSLFVCKLPKGTTIEEVSDLFSKFGALAEESPIRLFTGQNNCYARVNFASEESVRNAKAADIRLGDVAIVTDNWTPRNRPYSVRRRHRQMTNENRNIVVNSNQ